MQASNDTVRFLNYELPEGMSVRVSESEWEILERINRKVAAHSSLDQIIDFVFETMRPIRSSDRLGLAFIEERGKRIVLHHVVADYESMKLRKGYSADLLDGSLKKVVDNKVIRIINDLESYSREHPESNSSKLILEEGIRSSMTCPLYVEDRCVGLVFWSSLKPHTYDEQVVRRHQAVAERLGQAVENAYLIEQLKRVNNAYMDMLGFVSHELKDPIAAIITHATLMHDGYLGELTDEQKQKLANMKTKGEYLLGIVKQYLNLARLETGKIEPSYFHVEDVVSEFVEPSIEMLKDRESLHEMSLERDFPEEKIAADCDPDLLMIVITNLLTNAFRYGSKGGKVRIGVKAGSGHVSFSVFNDGPGFSEQEKKLLFRKFSRLPSHQKSRKIGTGLGLYMAWNIINAHKGTICAESKPGEWACFSFVIPVSPGKVE